jgi:hypothetical protein
MSRNIITKRAITTLGVEQTPKEDPYVSKIIKLIPADIISVYLAVFNIVKSNNQNADGNSTLQWIVFGLLLAITPFYFKKVAQINTTKQIVFLHNFICRLGILIRRTFGRCKYWGLHGTVFRCCISSHLYFAYSITLQSNRIKIIIN